MTSWRVSHPRGSLTETYAPNPYTCGATLGSWSRMAGLSMAKCMGLHSKSWQLFSGLLLDKCSLACKGASLELTLWAEAVQP
jgi:hypothetical protein